MPYNLAERYWLAGGVVKEFLDILTKYVSGEQPCSAVEEWLAGVDWNDPVLTQDGRNILGLFEVLATEVSEGMRDESELVREARKLLTNEKSGVFLKEAGVVYGMTARGDKDLSTRMVEDKGFVEGTERGLEDIEQGRYSRIEDVKRRLSDL